MPAIHRILIANRGEIARRIIRAADAMGIGTVAVFADPDADAPFVREAGEAVALDGNTSTETYLSVEKLLRAAERSGADAVHPGYGFLSENAGFARAVVEAGLTWIGPSADAIAAMGDKLAAKRTLTIAGVPTLPSVEVTAMGPEELLRAAETIGYPVLVKASAGGGGRGMRIVREVEQLANSVVSARREAKNAFADDTVFLEKYLDAPRHIEVQIFGDSHGHVVHLFERECSIQRRHQKVIEESPSSAVSPDLRERMGATAVAAGRAIGYSGAGTVEFLLDEAGDYYFLEMNTRLQVEHPVTEAITGIDLVREQIRVARGEPLSFRQDELRITGHAVEARLYAEDPAKSFFPAAGPVLLWEPAGTPDARFDSGVETGSEVSVYFDPMLAKVICHAATRTEAALRLASALERLRVHGLTTNREFLVATLRHEAFLAGDTTTAFIDLHRPAREREPSDEDLLFAATAVALFDQDRKTRASPERAGFGYGWRIGPAVADRLTFRYRDKEILLEFERRANRGWRIRSGEREAEAKLALEGDDRIALEVDGVRRSLALFNRGEQWWVQDVRGEVRLSVKPAFVVGGEGEREGGYKAPMPGKVASVHVKKGDRVARGQLLVILEAMKMEHRIVANEDGVIAELTVAEGQQVAVDEVLVVFEQRAKVAGGGKS